MKKTIKILAILIIASLTFAGKMYIHMNVGPDYEIEINDIEKITFSDEPFVWCTIPAGDYTYGPGDTIRNIDYDYQIMENEVTNQQYVDYMEEALNSGDIWVEGEYVKTYYPGDDNIQAGDQNIYHLGIPDTYNYARISYDIDEFIINVPSGYSPGDFDDHPVVEVTWFGAWAFSEQYGLRLPTEHEWEKAARGNTGWDYPWGDTITDDRANYIDSNDPWEPGTTPVGMYNGQTIQGFSTTDSPSPYGVYDMAGNVNEWTDSWYNTTQRVLRGGCWFVTTSYLYSWSRRDDTPTPGFPWYGFRCCRDQ